MDVTDFARAAFEPSHRPALLRAMQADPVLRDKARKLVAKLSEDHQRGQMFDRCHISKTTHETLTRMLAQCDAAGPSEISVT